MNGDFASAFQELMQIQKKIDDSARRLVEGAKVLVTHRAEYQPVRADDYPDRDAAYYDGTATDLAAAGVRVIGDFADAAFDRRHPDKHTFTRFGVAADGSIAANWFVLGPSRSLTLQTWLEDGRTVLTIRSAVESTYPRPPETLAQHVGPDMTTAELIALHRRRVAEARSVPRTIHGQDHLLAAYAAHEEATARFRERLGPGIVEQSLRKKLGDRYVAKGEPLVAAINAHPEWWTGEAPAPADPLQGPRMLRVKFLASREKDGSLHFTTFGLMMHMLPELQMKRVAANHCRAARFLMGVVTLKLAGEIPHGPIASGLELALTRDDVTAASPFISFGQYPEVEEPGPVAIRLVLEGFGQKRGFLSMFRTDPELLHLVPPAGYASDKDEWLRQMCRRLGQDAPASLPRERLHEAMAAASRKARETLAAVRARFARGLPHDQVLLVKVGLATKRGDDEYAWVRVGEWHNGGAVSGTLESTPRDVDGLKRGQDMQVPEGDVFDWAMFSKQRGVVEGGGTDVVAQEFGVDL